jgi:uncharacterized lipoprotein NlpE involved in copper resistance
MKSKLLVAASLVIFSFSLAGCQPTKTPADVVIAYLEALAEKDQTKAVANSCAAWEEKAIAEGASFINVEVSLENPQCQVRSESEIEAIVDCTGKFISSYSAGENQELDLSDLAFSLIYENGDWRMCGYDF